MDWPMRLIAYPKGASALFLPAAGSLLPPWYRRKTWPCCKVMEDAEDIRAARKVLKEYDRNPSVFKPLVEYPRERKAPR